MAEERPYQPSARQLLEARNRGEVPYSLDLTRTAVLLCALLVLRATAGDLLASIEQAFRDAFTAIGAQGASEVESLKAALLLATTAIAPLLLAALLAAVLTGLVQVGPLFAPGAVAPRPSRIDPAAGFRRLFSQQGALELLKLCVKLAVVGAVLFFSLRDGARAIASLTERDARSSLAIAAALVFDLSIRVTAALALLAALDFFLQRHLHRRRLRMTRRQWERELRESEADPRVRGQMREVGRQLPAAAQIEAVTGSDLLVCGPGSTAVALRYRERDDGETGSGQPRAPRVTASASGELARRMAREAEAAGVASVQDDALARELSRLSPGEIIPERLYLPVANWLREVWTRRERERDGEPEW